MGYTRWIPCLKGATALFCLLAVLPAAGQARLAPTVKVRWQGTVSYTDPKGQQSIRLTLKDASHLTSEGGNPVLSVVEDGTLSAYRLKDAVYRALSKAEKNLLDTTLALRPAVDLQPGIQARQPKTLVLIRTLRRNPATHQLEKLLGYTPAPQRATSAARTGSTEDDSTAVTARLASGNWVKVGVTQTAVYKVTGTDLRGMGIDIGSVNPANLHVYGRGGAMLPEVIGIQPGGLREMAIQVSGDGDGRFDDGDYLLFYGEGPVTWRYNATAGAFGHEYNLYADTIQYIVGADATPGLRVQAMAGGGGAALASYQNLQVFEKDNVTLLKGGRRWFGDSFDLTVSKDISFQTPGLVAGSTGQVRVVAAARSVGSNTFMQASVGGTAVAKADIASVSSYVFGDNYEAGDASGTFAAAGGDNLTVHLDYSKGTNDGAIGYLDFIEVNTRQHPNWNGQGFAAWLPEQAGGQPAVLPVNNLPVSGQAWSVADPLAPAALPSVGGQVQVPGGTAAQLFIFSPETARTPQLLGKLANQNLASVGAPVLLVIAPPFLLEQANAYATYRQGQSGLSVLVVTPQQVYNEFSGGHQDIAALRDFVVSLYNKPGSALKYVLLFGDGSLDYKYRLAQNTNLVPMYERKEWRGPVEAWASDDFYAMMDRGEGNISDLGSNMRDLGVGRLPIKTAEEAANVVAKIQRYESDTAGLGSWRNVPGFCGR